MSRHSKNNCSAPVFSYSERQKLKNEYGTMSRRVGKDSQKEVDVCTLCLHPVRDPLTCPKGHLFCRECIFAHLLSQKKEIKKKLKSFEEQQRMFGIEESQRRAKEEEDRVRKFERTEISVVPQQPSRTPAATTTTAASASTAASSTTTNGGSSLIAQAMGANSPADPSQRRTESYWLPSSSPDAVVAKIERPPMDTKCPMGHNLKLKQLIKVDFTLTKGASIDSPNTVGLYSCHPCQKTLNSVPAVVLFKPCGHVVCKACSDKFVTRKKGASSASTSSAADMKECCVCTAKLPLETDIVVLQASGSGYAGGAGEEKLAKVTTPAPRFA